MTGIAFFYLFMGIGSVVSAYMLLVGDLRAKLYGFLGLVVCAGLSLLGTGFDPFMN